MTKNPISVLLNVSNMTVSIIRTLIIDSSLSFAFKLSTESFIYVFIILLLCSCLWLQIKHLMMMCRTGLMCSKNCEKKSPQKFQKKSPQKIQKKSSSQQVKIFWDISMFEIYRYKLCHCKVTQPLKIFIHAPLYEVKLPSFAECTY